MRPIALLWLAGCMLGYAACVKADQAADEMPDAQKIRFCERVRDHALQAFYNRERGRPMQLYAEDGGNGPRITNRIIRRIYDEPRMASPGEAEAFGRATCNAMMGTRAGSE